MYYRKWCGIKAKDECITILLLLQYGEFLLEYFLPKIT